MFLKLKKEIVEQNTKNKKKKKLEKKREGKLIHLCYKITEEIELYTYTYIPTYKNIYIHTYYCTYIFMYIETYSALAKP